MFDLLELRTTIAFAALVVRFICNPSSYNATSVESTVVRRASVSINTRNEVSDDLKGPCHLSRHVDVRSKPANTLGVVDSPIEGLIVVSALCNRISNKLSRSISHRMDSTILSFDL